jgi:hypothetical protein
MKSPMLKSISLTVASAVLACAVERVVRLSAWGCQMRVNLRMPKTLRSVLIGFAFVFSSSIPGWASVLDGTSVNGNLATAGGAGINFYDIGAASPQNPLFVPLPYLNHYGPTVVINGIDTEFGWCACGGTGGTHTSATADFTDTGLTVTSYSDYSWQYGWIQTFTDTAFAGLSINKTLDGYSNGGVSALIVGDVLTLTWLGQNGSEGPYTADFSFSGASATPLPAALPLFASGLGVFGLLARRKKRKAAAALAAA